MEGRLPSFYLPPKSIIQVIDLRGVLPGNAYGERTRPTTDAIIIHHTAGPANQTWEEIANLHLRRGYGGIGYHLGVEADGTICQFGDLAGWRWHIAYKNDRYIGVVLKGNFTETPPPDVQLASAHVALGWLAELGYDLPILGHGEAADPRSPTACPGLTFTAWKSLLSQSG